MAWGVGAVGYQALTVGSGNSTLTIPSVRPKAAFLSVETNSIRYRVDGTAPSSSEGHVIAAAGTLWLFGTDAIRNFQATRVSADAPLKVTYYRDVIA